MYRKSPPAIAIVMVHQDHATRELHMSVMNCELLAAPPSDADLEYGCLSDSYVSDDDRALAKTVSKPRAKKATACARATVASTSDSSSSSSSSGSNSSDSDSD